MSPFREHSRLSAIQAQTMSNPLPTTEEYRWGPMQYRKWAIWIVILMHIAVYFSCLTAPLFSSGGTSNLILGLCISCFASCLAFWASSSRILHLVVTWLAGTFTLKLPLCLYLPDDTFLNMLNIEEPMMGPLISAKYVTYTMGLLALVFTSMLLPVIFPRRQQNVMAQPYRATDNVFVIAVFACACAIAFRYFVFFVLDIGRPGVVPRQLLFPGLTGVIRLLNTTGTLVVISGTLALALTRRSMGAFLLATFFALVYLAMDLAIGYRRMLFLLLICYVWFFLFLNDRKLQTRLRPFIPLAAAAVLMLFGPVMSMRHNMLHGMSASEAVKQLVKVETYTSQDYAKTMIKLSQRLNGFDLYIVATEAFKDEPLGMIYLINNRFAGRFAYEVMGVPEDVVIGMGSTIWGFWGAVLGERWVWLCGVMIAFVIYFAEWACSLVSRFPAAVVVFEYNVSLWVLRLIMSSGTLVLSAKDALIISTMLFIFYRLTWGNEKMKELTKRQTWQMRYRFG